jgi:hypothetical protein
VVATAVVANPLPNVFEPGVDPLLASVAPAGIDPAGVVWLDLADGAAAAAVAALAQKTFWVGLDLAQPFGPFAASTLRVSVLTDGGAVCEAEDRSHDIPLALQWAANVSTSTQALVDVFLRDGFETGNASRWWAVYP